GLEPGIYGTRRPVLVVVYMDIRRQVSIQPIIYRGIQDIILPTVMPAFGRVWIVGSQGIQVIAQAIGQAILLLIVELEDRPDLEPPQPIEPFGRKTDHTLVVGLLGHTQTTTVVLLVEL